MELRQLKYFIATAEELHFRRAAELVHVAQPALSQQIRQLEEEIGVQLFERTNRKVTLTSAGRVFYERARVIVDNGCNALHEARSIGRGDAGTVAVGFISTAAMKVLPAALRHFKDHIPSAQIELREMGPAEQMDDLQRGHLDLGLTIAEILDEDFEVVEIAHERLLAAVPDTEAFRGREEVRLEDLSGYTLIIPVRHSRRGYYETVLDAYRKAGARRPNLQCVRMIQTGLMLVGAGLGIELIPESFTHIRLEGVRYLRLPEPAPEITISAVFRKDNASPLLRKFVKEFLEVFPG